MLTSKKTHWWYSIQYALSPLCEFCPLPCALSGFLRHALLRKIYTEGRIEQDRGWDFSYPMLAIAYGSRIITSMCHGIACQVSDRSLFVHKSHPVISSIFETIKQWRENGWFGNPWILICQHNEIEWGRWWKCAVWEVAADVRKEQTFFFSFSTRLLSFTALPCGHDGNNSLPAVCNCKKPGCDCQWDASCGSCISGKPATRENPQASDRLCYDHTSRRELVSNQWGSGLCPKPCTWRFYMEEQAKGKKKQLNARNRNPKALSHVEFKEKTIATTTIYSIETALHLK